MRFKRAGKPLPITKLTDIIHRQYFQQVRVFIDLGLNLNKTDDERRTPLMLCALMEPEMWGIGIARLLIEKGAILDSCDRYGLNAMHLACIYNRTELCRVLINALDFDLLEQDKWGNTPLHYAVRNGNINLVRLIVQTQCKYKLAFDKKNKDHLTPLDEANKQSFREIAEILEEAEHPSYLDSEPFPHVPAIHIRPSSGSRDGSRTCLSDIGSGSLRRSFISRPKTAFGARRGSVSSNSSASSLYMQHKTVRSYRNGTRREIEPNEKDNAKILHCASASDFRNNAEYLYHLLQPGLIQNNGNSLFSFRNGRPTSAILPKPSASSFMGEGPNLSWRVEFKHLYKHYEFQCSPSYRDGVKLISSDGYYFDNPPTPAPSDDNPDDDKSSKKSKRASSAVKQSLEKQRKQSAQQQKQESQRNRKTSSVQPPHGHGRVSATSIDAMESSSESISSSTSQKKNTDSLSKSQTDKNNTGTGSDVHGRQSRASHYKAPIVN